MAFVGCYQFDLTETNSHAIVLTTIYSRLSAAQGHPHKRNHRKYIESISQVVNINKPKEKKTRIRSKFKHIHISIYLRTPSMTELIAASILKQLNVNVYICKVSASLARSFIENAQRRIDHWPTHTVKFKPQQKRTDTGT